MRGTDDVTGSLFSYMDIEARHPLRTIRQVVNEALAGLDAEFDRLYLTEGRPSIAPERLIRLRATAVGGAGNGFPDCLAGVAHPSAS